MQRKEQSLITDIYWCRKDDHIQIGPDQCTICNKSMEKIGFIEDNEGDEE